LRVFHLVRGELELGMLFLGDWMQNEERVLGLDMAGRTYRRRGFGRRLVEDNLRHLWLLGTKCCSASSVP